MDRRCPQMGSPIHSVPHASGDGPRYQDRQPQDQECSPREWGWTGLHDDIPMARMVFPTRVGMDRLRPPLRRSRARVPHASGDGPMIGNAWPGETGCSPREWGWTAQCLYHPWIQSVFPTRVGMDRYHLGLYVERARVPHASGDGPTLFERYGLTLECSPREWGWTVSQSFIVQSSTVFPTRVGMDRPRSRRSEDRRSVPHASGDGPNFGWLPVRISMCSPREWGWTEDQGLDYLSRRVFPTRVGMDRMKMVRVSGRACVPHASGDGPERTSP